MNAPDAIHKDVAAYALGILDEEGTAEFEFHLAGCPTCAMELESLLPVTALLSQVDGDSVVGAEEMVREGRMLDEMVNAVAYDRSQVRARRFLALAAGVVAIVLVGALSVLAGTSVGRNEAPPAAAGTTSAKARTTGGTGPGIGGPFSDLPGEKFQATDADTKVSANVALQGTEWGTQVSLLVSSIKGPLTCQLVAVGEDGVGEIVYTWSVPAKGYGTDLNPQPLLLQGATAVPRADMVRMEIQSVDEAGRPALLVAVDV
jgi:hypothetical protein